MMPNGPAASALRLTFILRLAVIDNHKSQGAKQKRGIQAISNESQQNAVLGQAGTLESTPAPLAIIVTTLRRGLDTHLVNDSQPKLNELNFRLRKRVQKLDRQDSQSRWHASCK